jgi:hypothetical protein
MSLCTLSKAYDFYTRHKWTNLIELIHDDNTSCLVYIVYYTCSLVKVQGRLTTWKKMQKVRLNLYYCIMKPNLSCIIIQNIAQITFVTEFGFTGSLILVMAFCHSHFIAEIIKPRECCSSHKKIITTTTTPISW